ncbi:hypothetical protein AB6A40_007605 [Gnathostoma spinigerum]|uniref:Choline/carnitine acyltransferase domain-containing protein n=1 Tax=Gnathostoma spinigerum TaxID=75299 RepID=A0ABD6ENN1_9BILA
MKRNTWASLVPQLSFWINSSTVVGKRSLSGEAYQFLHKSEIPSYHFQKSLRRLPIPKLNDSCSRLLCAAAAVFHREEFEKFKDVVTSFQNNEGPALQMELLAHDRRNKSTSYISEPWFDMYLRDRRPCPVNFNPFMMYAADPNPFYNEQVARATNFVISYGRMKRALDENYLAPEVYHINPKQSDTKLFRTVCKLLPPSLSWFGAAAFKAFPLDMSQYKSLFGTTRVPQIGKDRLLHRPDAKHFIVMHGGEIYTVDLFDDKGELYPPKQVHSCLSAIKRIPVTIKREECIGSLTTLGRDEWAQIREELLSIGDNCTALNAIEESLFAVCFDSSNTEDPKLLCQNLLIGNDAYNRYFDKCFQLIVDSLGNATINFEHSWGDGVAVLRLMEESLRDTKKYHFVSPNDETLDTMAHGHFRKLDFTLNTFLRNKIMEAQQNHIALSSRMQFATVEYSKMNKNTIKNSKLSPDALMQLAIQLAFYRIYKDFVPTYESCSTAAFLKGRTECVRSATTATKNAVIAIENGGKDLRSLINVCSNVHSQLVKEAALGQGFDRHLLGLRVTAQRLGHDIPQLFIDPLFESLNHFVLSTSTLSTETVILGGFGPVVNDGYGIAYNVDSSMLGACISSYKDKRDAERFGSSLVESLDILKYFVESDRSV